MIQWQYRGCYKGTVKDGGHIFQFFVDTVDVEKMGYTWYNPATLTTNLPASFQILVSTIGSVTLLFTLVPMENYGRRWMLQVNHLYMANFHEFSMAKSNCQKLICSQPPTKQIWILTDGSSSLQVSECSWGRCQPYHQLWGHLQSPRMVDFRNRDQNCNCSLVS